jgi:hypothetical protein
MFNMIRGIPALQGGEEVKVDDLMRLKDNKGVISVLRVMDMQDKPQLFSTFMLKMLQNPC